MISPGASVTEGQAVMALETDKGVIEVPSSVSGTVKEVRVKEGDKLKVGQVIFTVENGTGAKAQTASRSKTAEPKTAEPKPAEARISDEKNSEITTIQASSETEEVSPAETATSSESQLDSEKTSASAPAITGRRRATDVAVAGISEFKLPELGENIEQGDLVRLMIAPGSTVTEGQPVMELETDKAVVEVPSSVSGIVKEVKVKQGEKVKVGQVIFTLEGNATPEPERRQQPHTSPVEHLSGQQAARLAFQAAIHAEGKTEEQALPRDKPVATPPVFTMPAQLGKVAGTEHREPVPAAPHVRRLARELGVDIQAVEGTGPGGR